MLPLFFPFVDVLNETGGCFELLFGDIAGNLRHIMSCIDERLKRSIDHHLLLCLIFIRHFLELDWKGPHPIRINEEESV